MTVRRSVGGSPVPVALACVLTFATSATACGSDGDAAADEPRTVVTDGLVVRDAWTRPTPPGASEAAIYVTIENRDAPDDRFVGAVAERCVATHPHLTRIDGDGVASMGDADVDVLGLPRGGELVMEPTGLHVMCLGLAVPLTNGERFDLELRFAEHDPVAVEVLVEQR